MNNIHMVCPNIIVDSRTALCIRDKQLTALNEEYPEVDWGDIVDKRVLTANVCVSAGMTGSCVSVSSQNFLPQSQRLPHAFFAFELHVSHNCMSR